MRLFCHSSAYSEYIYCVPTTLQDPHNAEIAPPNNILGKIETINKKTNWV